MGGCEIKFYTVLQMTPTANSYLEMDDGGIYAWDNCIHHVGDWGDFFPFRMVAPLLTMMIASLLRCTVYCTL